MKQKPLYRIYWKYPTENEYKLPDIWHLFESIEHFESTIDDIEARAQKRDYLLELVKFEE